MKDEFSLSYRYTIQPTAAQAAPASPIGAADRGRWSYFAAGAWLGLATIGIILSLWGHLLIGLNNDHLTLMDQTRKLLAGARPYVDFTDVSPPLIHMLFMAPVWLSNALGVKLYLALYAFVYAAIALGALTSWKIMLYSGAGRMQRWLVVTTIALALLGTSFIHQVFGDREHLMMVLISPWLVLYSPLAQRERVPIRWRMAAAAMAAVGFAIKPYFYIFYAVTSLFELLSGRTLREILRQHEHHIVWAFGLTYTAVVVLFFRAYITSMLPIGLQTYAAISWPWESKMSMITEEMFGGYGITGLAAVVLLWIFAPRFYDPVLTYVLLLLLAGLGDYVLNGGWYYTQYPFIAMALVLAVAAGARLVLACSQKRQPLMLIAVCALMAGGLAMYYVIPAAWRADWDIRLQRERGHTLSTIEQPAEVRKRVEAHLDSHPRFMFLSTNYWSVNLLKEGTPRTNVSRFDYLWPLPGIVALQTQPNTRSRQESLMRWLVGGLVEDITRHAPDMVIIDVSTEQRSLPNSYDLMEMLNTYPDFTRAFAKYRLADIIDKCNPQQKENCAYRVYYRR